MQNFINIDRKAQHLYQLSIKAPVEQIAQTAEKLSQICF